MSVSAEERSMRRRLVYNAMPEDTSIDVINKSIEILENEFGNEPQIKYSKLIKRLGEAIDSNVKFGPVLGRIMILRRKTAEEIGPDPGVVESTNNVSSQVPRDIVFNAVFASIAQQVGNRCEAVRTDFTNWLSKDASTWDLSTECVSELGHWASNSQSHPNVSGGVDHLQKIINQCFVWMCGKFGPVDTDKILLRALNSAADLPAAIEFPPKKLM
jgi:hypothetical protein